MNKIKLNATRALIIIGVILILVIFYVYGGIEGVGKAIGRAIG
jgi:hypothetical protein